MRAHLLTLAPIMLIAACGTTETNSTAAENGTELGTANDAATMEMADGNQSSATTTARAMLKDASGADRGEATLTQVGDAVRINISATGLEAGERGYHIHTTGRCEGPAFESAGGHWNPTDRQHGRDNPQGQHLGDLPNLTIGADGRGTIEATIQNATLTGGTNPVLDDDGAAVMIHAGPDDYRTDPSGDSGSRIACGVVEAG
ncbi:Cu-Zn family superoxide dismutase [Sphingomonas jejuensis]|uniref:Superoxide dismutase [Cu-Zn] n=1 Tax=Sphingomonas jejuensis TaxID=904715 RepID=A0ABX0XHY3_9SPHN|nr:superoxide dismutase family protein [Sphingomonas jejuensis]NJC32835.1 Cu-Zn family superoxide dismutase [Sphingomonas jejuensis]